MGDFFAEVCPFLVCGENAIKTVNPDDVADCYCSCPHNAQGDPLFSCKGLVDFNGQRQRKI